MQLWNAVAFNGDQPKTTSDQLYFDVVFHEGERLAYRYCCLVTVTEVKFSVSSKCMEITHVAKHDKEM